MSDEPFVAKFAYDTQAHFEVGLACAELLAAHGFRTAEPVRTKAGQLTVTVPGPPGHHHPLALMRHVPGAPLSRAAPSAAATIGQTHGAMQRILSEHGHRLGLAKPATPHYVAYLEERSTPVADEDWLRPALERVVTRVRAIEVTQMIWSVGVFDGPELLVDDDGAVGLIDFGNVAWQPAVFSLASQVALAERAAGGDAARQLVAAWIGEMPLPDGDLAALETYVLVCIAIYAKFAAYKLRHGIDRGASADESRRSLDSYRRVLDT
jgi:Ser/Thr protein kinase RdoA (MazF antagonist)